MDQQDHLKGERYLSFFLLILALMAFALVVKSCNIAQYQHQQQTQQVQHQANGNATQRH